jgi:hypothetical protein
MENKLLRWIRNGTGLVPKIFSSFTALSFFLCFTGYQSDAHTHTPIYTQLRLVVVLSLFSSIIHLGIRFVSIVTSTMSGYSVPPGFPFDEKVMSSGASAPPGPPPGPPPPLPTGTLPFFSMDMDGLNDSQQYLATIDNRSANLELPLSSKCIWFISLDNDDE